MSLLHLSFLAVGFLVLGLCRIDVRRPEVLYAWEGTCVQIPCTYKIINSIQTPNHFIWYHNPQYDNKEERFHGTVLFDMFKSSKNERTQFLGELSKEDCSLLLHPVQVSDSGKLGLRIMTQEDKWIAYVQLNITESAPQPHIQLPPRLQELQEVTVTCCLNYSCPGYPVSLLWFLDGQKVPAQVENSIVQTEKVLTESKFRFRPSWTHHGKKLSCQVWHTDEQRLSEKIVWLDVKHTPKITIEASPHLEVKEEGSVTLRCMVRSSNPKVQGSFLWFKDKENVQNQDEILTLSEVNWQQAGNYHCEADNEMGRGRSEPVHLQVLYSPKLSRVLPADISVRENRTVELMCATVASPPPTSYTWYQDEKLLLGETKQNLSFQGVNRQQSGLYSCLAENSEGQGKVSERARLDVQYPPTGVTVIISSQMPIREGDSVTLSCSYKQSNPAVKSYLWRPQLFQKVGYSANVTIQSIPWNAESVTCSACNIECSQAAPVYLDVQYAPRDVKIILATPKSDIRSGDQVQLRCDFSSSRPRNVHYSWTQNGKHFHEGRDLNWSSISPEDSALYSCSVTNSIGQTKSQEWDLKVQYAPRHLRVSIVPGDVVMEKTSVILTCEADANPAIDFYTWFDWKGQKIDKYGQKLTLWPVMTHQSGAYWCQGTNKLGTGKSGPATLTVYYSPETIGKRTALGFGVCLAVLFLVLMGFQFVRCWKKIRREEDIQDRPGIQGSFFIRKKKTRRPHATAAPQSLGYYNPALEGRIDYATLQFPDRALSPRYLETSPVSLQTEDQSVTYSVLQKPHGGDYENVMPQAPPEDEGLHYSELIHFGEPGRHPVQEGVEYVTLKH
ncbi:B-cell receptor CD22 isoform X1 [Phascolarctos cinereus]|uniref:B-cell receptor CD22 n=1 Tax=Phascolarctos cinereus TaxID=38626 RepID=A0A6P5JN85_PHACI|nr:B-cell receptor CD22 isoform X1 [Phascolarctos cinereus]XP_020832657.1 B-cell receptor CD22 isoform X1 [Phascolarctos cinereus]